MTIATECDYPTTSTTSVYNWLVRIIVKLANRQIAATASSLL